VGKSTIFSALTSAPAEAANYPFCTIEPNVGVVHVPDDRLAQIAKIATAKPPKAPKFFYGGSTGNTASLGYDEYGPVTGYVHKNEYVIPESMTQDPQFANTIGWLEQNRQQKMRGYVEGGATSPGPIPQNITASNEASQLLVVISQLTAVLSNGINAKLNIGYKDVKAIDEMNNEIKSSNQNGTIG
jgi:hypothetical protein